MPAETVVLASDHAGVELKQQLRAVIESRGLEVLDLGAHDGGSVDYPDMAEPSPPPWATAGRSAACWCAAPASASASPPTATATSVPPCATTSPPPRLARQHNDANVLVLGARVVGASVARDCLAAFLDTPFEGGRHQRRVDKLADRPVAIRAGCYSPAPGGAGRSRSVGCAARSAARKIPR